jgi:hypothetical protein
VDLVLNEDPRKLAALEELMKVLLHKPFGVEL